MPSETPPPGPAALATHHQAVGRLAEAVARELGLPEPEIRLAKLTAEFHDIGKSEIPDAILDKRGALTANEWEAMERHTLIGEQILSVAPGLRSIAPLVRSTHERVDGNGYPDGLRGDGIPLSSRIVAVVDAYDAITTGRPYRGRRGSAQAIDELRRCSGSQFDPDAVAALVAVCERHDNTVWRSAQPGRCRPRSSSNAVLPDAILDIPTG